MAPAVLVIDDDPRSRGLLRNGLELEGIRVAEQEPCARPGAEALGPGYAVILVDIVMPEKDGFEYLRQIRRLWPDQRVVLYSRGLSEYPHYAVKLGADAGIDIGQAAGLRHLLETARRLATVP